MTRVQLHMQPGENRAFKITTNMADAILEAYEQLLKEFYQTSVAQGFIGQEGQQRRRQKGAFENLARLNQLAKEVRRADDGSDRWGFVRGRQRPD